MWQINYPVSNLVARHRGTLPVPGENSQAGATVGGPS